MPFIDISSPQWIPYLEIEQHDLYHLPEYVALDAQWMRGEPLAWICIKDDCQCLIPLIRRPINSNERVYDLVSPYGYPGILPLKSLTAVEASRAVNHFRLDAAAAGYISSFIRLNPFLNNWILPALPDLPDLSHMDEFSQCLHGITLSIDLSDLYSNTKGYSYTSDYSYTSGQPTYNFSLNHRRNLRQLHQKGYTTAINLWNLLPEFSQAYTATMIRRKAAPRYLYTEDYFNRLRGIASEHLIFITVSSPQGEFCCGGLFSLFGRTIQYLFGATVEGARHHSPSKLMIEEAIIVGVNHGAEVLHLGGGVGAGIKDGVFRFKQGFAHKSHAFQCLHFIHRPEIYQRLEQSAVSSYTSTDYSNSCTAPSSSCMSHAQREAFIENPSMLLAAEESSNYGDNPQFFPSYRASDD